MAAYLANHQKKKRLLAKRERELLHALGNDLSDARIIKAAERLRAAKLSIFKMEFSRTSTLPASPYLPEGEALEWLEMSVDAIVAKYR